MTQVTQGEANYPDPGRSDDQGGDRAPRIVGDLIFPCIQLEDLLGSHLPPTAKFTYLQAQKLLAGRGWRLGPLWWHRGEVFGVVRAVWLERSELARVKCSRLSGEDKQGERRQRVFGLNLPTRLTSSIVNSHRGTSTI